MVLELFTRYQNLQMILHFQVYRISTQLLSFWKIWTYYKDSLKVLIELLRHIHTSVCSSPFPNLHPPHPPSSQKNPISFSWSIFTTSYETYIMNVKDFSTPDIQWHGKVPFHWLAQNLLHKKLERWLLTTSKFEVITVILYQVGIGS